jgi:PAS domain S-box-containing protein
MDMSQPRSAAWAGPSAIARYTIAVMSVAIAIVAAELLTRTLDTEPIASSMLCAVMFAAWFGGFGPGLAAIALSLLAVHYYLVPPANSFALKQDIFAFQLAELPRLVLFSITSLIINFMSSAQRSAKEAALQAEAKAARAEREIRLVTDTIPALVCSASPDGAGEYFNQRWLAYTGLTLEQARGWGFIDAYHPEDRAAVRNLAAHGSRHGTAADEIQTEARLRGVDGTYRWFLGRDVALRDEAGNIIRWYGTTIDIEDRKRAEDALRLSEQRYRHLFQHMPIALLQVNASKVVELLKRLRSEGVTELGPYLDRHPDLLQQFMDADRIEEVNEHAIEMLGGHHASELLGSLARLYSPEVFRRGLESRWRGERTHQEETKLMTLDGRNIDVLKTVTRPGLASDPNLSLVGVIDITERVRAQEMLQRVQADFAHAARVSMLGELTASIAHEVNQPLAAIAINGEVVLRLLGRPEPDMGEVREMAECVVNDARRAADIIARVRTMATRQAPEQELLSIDEVIHEALLFLRHEIQSHGLTVTHHLNAAAPKVFGDRTQLQQVFVNLAANAIQATAQCTRRTIVIRTTLSGPHTLCCSLEDSGPGIKPEHLDRLFDSFFTTKEAGMGLGLAISRSIVEAHGGHIRADSESAFGGARFSFTLPVTLQ